MPDAAYVQKIADTHKKFARIYKNNSNETIFGYLLPFSLHDYSKNHVQIALLVSKQEFKEKQERRHHLAKMITEYLHEKIPDESNSGSEREEVLVEFSVLELREMIESRSGMFSIKASIDDIEDSLFYLSRIEAIKIEGGFLVVHNRLSIDRIEKNNRIQYKESDYEKLKQFYQQKKA